MTQSSSDAPLLERLARGALAAQSLTDVLWEAIHEELSAARALSDNSPERAIELSERLAQVAGTVALLAHSGVPSSSPPAPADERGRSKEEPPTPEPADDPEPSGGRRQTIEMEGPARGRARAGGAPSPAVTSGTDEPTPTPAIIVDERAPFEDSSPRASGRSRTSERAPAIEIRDERSTTARETELTETELTETELAIESGATPWIASIERRLERYACDGLPFAVLLLELVDVERLRHAELPGEMARLTSLVEAALAAELRPADALMRESPGRYWLLAPETDSLAAKQLAAALAAGVRASASHRGVPLRLAAGIAACPEDGRRAAALAARADIALYAAQSVGAASARAEE